MLFDEPRYEGEDLAGSRCFDQPVDTFATGIILDRLDCVTFTRIDRVVGAETQSQGALLFIWLTHQEQSIVAEHTAHVLREYQTIGPRAADQNGTNPRRRAIHGVT